MKSTETFFKAPPYEDLLKEIKQDLLCSKRPANEVILDETDFCSFLKISKRHAANLRTSGAITYSKAGGKLYYLLSDILDFIEKNKIEGYESPINIFKRKK